MTRAPAIDAAARALLAYGDSLDAGKADYPDWDRHYDALRAALDLPEEGSEEQIARHIHGLIEAGELLMLHVQRIDWDPAAAVMARECWLESVAALNGDNAPKYWPKDAAPADPEEGDVGNVIDSTTGIYRMGYARGVEEAARVAQDEGNFWREQPGDHRVAMWQGCNAAADRIRALLHSPAPSPADFSTQHPPQHEGAPHDSKSAVHRHRHHGPGMGQGGRVDLSVRRDDPRGSAVSEGDSERQRQDADRQPGSAGAVQVGHDVLRGLHPRDLIRQAAENVRPVVEREAAEARNATPLPPLDAARSPAPSPSYSGPPLLAAAVRRGEISNAAAYSAPSTASGEAPAAPTGERCAACGVEREIHLTYRPDHHYEGGTGHTGGER